MRMLLLLHLLASPAAFAAPVWPSTGASVIGPGGASELEADGAGFVVGRPTEMNGTGMLALVQPDGAPSSLIPTQTEPGAEFGFRVAVIGDLMAVTEARRGLLFPESGAAIKIYERTGGIWSMSFFTLSPHQPSTGAQYGHGLAVEQDRVFVGAPGFLTQRGVVYVYERTAAGTWPLDPTGSVFAFDGTSHDAFGTAADAEGDWLAISAPLMERDPATESQGAVYMFRQIDGVYVQQQRLMAPSPQSDAQFGSAIDLDGGSLVVGAVTEDDPATGQDAGAVYVYDLVGSQWELQQRLSAGDGAPGDLFGHGVAKNGETLVAAASLDDNEFGVNMGTAYVFEHIGGSWQETGRIAPAKPPVTISQTAIARLDYVAPDVLVRYYPTTERIFVGSFEN